MNGFLRDHNSTFVYGSGTYFAARAEYSLQVCGLAPSCAIEPAAGFPFLGSFDRHFSRHPRGRTNTRKRTRTAFGTSYLPVFYAAVSGAVSTNRSRI
eukprot:SAG11_NODE_466_length_9212_cov_2.301986_8_plen_97_part_00